MTSLGTFHDLKVKFQQCQFSLFKETVILQARTERDTEVVHAPPGYIKSALSLVLMQLKQGLDS